MSKSRSLPFQPVRAPKIPAKSLRVNHFHYAESATVPAAGGMGIQSGYAGDPLPPSNLAAGSGGCGLYTAFRSDKPLLAIFIDGRLGRVCRTGNLNVLEVDREQALELAMQLIEYAKLPEGTNMVSGLSGGGGGGGGCRGGGNRAGGG